MEVLARYLESAGEAPAASAPAEAEPAEPAVAPV